MAPVTDPNPDGPSRWLVTVMCLYGAGATGMIYLFSVYSGALKQQFGFSQTQLEAINTSMFAAGTITVLPGMLVDRVGPGHSMRLGGSLMASIFLLQFLVVHRRLGLSDGAVLPMMCFMCSVQFLCSSCITASVFSCLKTIYKPHESSGFVVGLGKGWVGLFGAIVTQLYKYTAGDVDNSPQTFMFLIFLAGAAAALTLVPSFIVTKAVSTQVNGRPQPYMDRMRGMVGAACFLCSAPC